MQFFPTFPTFPIYIHFFPTKIAFTFIFIPLSIRIIVFLLILQYTLINILNPLIDSWMRILDPRIQKIWSNSRSRLFKQFNQTIF